MLLLSPNNCYGQSLERDKVFKLIRDRFASLTDLEAKLTLTRQNSRLTLVPVQQKGKIKYLALRPNASILVRVDLKDPKETVSVSNYGYSIYSPKLQQVMKGSAGSESKNARYTELFHMAFRLLSEFEKEYKAVYIGKTTINRGESAHHLMFTPKSVVRTPITETNDQTIELWIDPTGLPVQLKAYDSNTSITLFLSKIRTNRNINSSKFDVKLAKGTKVILEQSIITAMSDPLISTVIQNRPFKKPPAVSAGGSIIRQIFRRMREHFNALTSLRANIIMVQKNSQFGINETSEGRIVCVAPRRAKMMFRTDFPKPRETVRVVDRNYIFYRPALGQAWIGTIDSFARRGGILSFLYMSLEQLKAEYQITYLGESEIKGEIRTWHLRFTPKFRRVFQFAEVWVDSNGMPLQFSAVAPNGDSTTVLLTNLQKNESISASEFKVDLPKGTKIIRN